MIALKLIVLMVLQAALMVLSVAALIFVLGIMLGLVIAGFVVRRVPEPTP